MWLLQSIVGILFSWGLLFLANKLDDQNYKINADIASSCTNNHKAVLKLSKDEKFLITCSVSKYDE